jgi:hypothetical protein
VGAVLASVFMALSGFFVAAAPLLLQRLLAGVASAFVFIAGGLLAARLGTRQPGQAGLLLGLYYGGVGWALRWRRWACRCCWMRRAACPTAGPGPGGAWRWRAWRPRRCCAGPPKYYKNRS